MITKRFLSVALNAALCAGAASMIGCSQQPSPSSSISASSTSPASASSAAVDTALAPASTPPTADQLYQLVAPIALFPDKLVAQVLAGATYPGQVSDADSFLEQNQSLRGSALQDAVDPQAWDPSIKGLTVFPKVLDQMAQNIPWTTALGTAYVNDPTDVLNAIQVMRQRASTHGSLHSSAQLRVIDQPATAVQTSYAAAPSGDTYDQSRYDGPEVIPPPQQTIEIQPADEGTVYVPEYDPRAVYGGDLQAYPSYRYDQPGYSSGDMVTTGVLAFGVGIVVASLFEHQHHDRPAYGWNSWDMQWRGDDRDRGYRNGDRWQGPAVVHNNTVYVSRSTTINKRYVTNNINNSVNNSNNRINSGNTTNRPAVTALNPGAPYPSSHPARTGNEPASMTHVDMPAQQPPTRPNFKGALSKGMPARFAHLAAQPPAHPGAMPVPTPVAGLRHPHVNMSGISAPAANRSNAYAMHPGDSARHEGPVLVPVQRKPTAVPGNGQRTEVSPNHTAERSLQHPVPTARPILVSHRVRTPPAPAAHEPAAPRPALAPSPREVQGVATSQPKREVPRPQAIQERAPRPMLESHRMRASSAPVAREQPAQRPIHTPSPREVERPVINQPRREAPRQQAMQERPAPQPHAVSRPPAAQHHAAAPRVDEHRKKDDKNH